MAPIHPGCPRAALISQKPLPEPRLSPYLEEPSGAVMRQHRAGDFSWCDVAGSSVAGIQDVAVLHGHPHPFLATRGVREKQMGWLR